MALPILKTKLVIPSIRNDRLARPELIAKLNRGLDYPFILVSAPAGSGKTTILSDWFSQINCLKAWYSLDQSDNDPVNFLIYLSTTVEYALGEFGKEGISKIEGVERGTYRSILIGVINRIVDQTEDLILVLDDFHLISTDEVLNLVLFLLENQPDNLHLVISSRINPALPLSRLRARNQLMELRGQDLNFNLDETVEFLNRIMDLGLNIKDIEKLEKRTEGWAAGLQLVALSLKDRENPWEFIDDFTGSHQIIASYLVEEIFSKLPDELKQFLIRTTILERFTVDLAQEITGCKNSGELIKALISKNIFIIQMDYEGNWFRYHHLFSDLLQARLSNYLDEKEINELRLKASDYFKANGEISEAINYTISAREFDRVTELIDRSAHELIYSGRVRTVRKWLITIPADEIRSRPKLMFYKTWIDVLQNHINLSEAVIQEMENLLDQLPGTDENEKLKGEFVSIVCRTVAFSGKTKEGIRLARKALTTVPSDDLASLARVNSSLAALLDFEGQHEEAVPLYQTCLAQAAKVGDIHLTTHTMMVMGLVYVQYGKLTEADQVFRSILNLEKWETHNEFEFFGSQRQIFYPAGQSYLGQAIVLLEKYQLDAAETLFLKGIDLCQQGGLDGLFIGKIRLSRLYQARGDLEQARKVLDFSKSGQRVDMVDISIRRISLALAEGDAKRAVSIAKPYLKVLMSSHPDVPIPLIFKEDLSLSIAEAFLADGEVDQANQLLDDVQRTAEPSNRKLRLIDIYLLRALAALLQKGQNSEGKAAMFCLRALELGVSDQLILRFKEKGSQLESTFQRISRNAETPAEIKEFLNQILTALTDQRDMSMGLVETLTPREFDVLGLLAAGFSNEKIANELVISIRTVKKHTSNIYGKLGVDNRTQAVIRAQELGLLK